MENNESTLQDRMNSTEDFTLVTGKPSMSREEAIKRLDNMSKKDKIESTITNLAKK